MSLRNLWKARSKPTISFEFFPVQGDKKMNRQKKAIHRLLTQDPDFISVTFGAGGSTREGSFELVKYLIETFDTEVIAYVAAFGLDPNELEKILNDYRELSVETVFCVRGDKPINEEEATQHPDSFSYAVEFLDFVKNRFDFCTGAAGYPEGHVEAISLDDDIQFLKEKVDRGAEFIIAQFCYDNSHFFKFVQRCRDIGIQVPILAGIMPIMNIDMLRNLADKCGASIPDSILEQLKKIPSENKEELQNFAYEFGFNQCRQLAQQNVDGIHFYTMNKSKTIASILDSLRIDNLI